MKMLRETAKEVLYFFGYVDHPKLKSSYPFVKFDDEDEDLLKQFEGFKQMNQDQLHYLIENKEEIKKMEFKIHETDVPEWPELVPNLPPSVDAIMKFSIKE